MNNEAKAPGSAFLAEAIVLGSGPAAMEAEGKRNQQEFVSNETALPAEMAKSELYEAIQYDTKAVLEKAGVKFLGPVEGDSVLQRVQLPAGWKKVPGYNPMLTMLVDDKDRERARVFYKNTYYQRCGSVNLESRYGVSDLSDWEPQLLKRGEGGYLLHIVDGCAVRGPRKPEDLLHEVEVPYHEDKKERFRARACAKKEAYAWLDENFPLWRDPTAYWD